MAADRARFHKSTDCELPSAFSAPLPELANDYSCKIGLAKSNLTKILMHSAIDEIAEVLTTADVIVAAAVAVLVVKRQQRVTLVVAAAAVCCYNAKKAPAAAAAKKKTICILVL